MQGRRKAKVQRSLRVRTNRKFAYQGKPISLRIPHAAAMPIAITNATPITLPVASLLLQPWSTATAQTTNNTIAITPRVFIHIPNPPDFFDLAIPSRLAEGLVSHLPVMDPEPAPIN